MNVELHTSISRRAAILAAILLVGLANGARVEAQAPLGAQVNGPFVSQPVTPGLSPAVRDLPLAAPGPAGKPRGEINPRQRPDFAPAGPLDEIRPADPLLQQSAGVSATASPSPILSFEGISATGGFPPDTNGDVGPNHYVQMVNTSFAIFDKGGHVLRPATEINWLWRGQNNACAEQSDGDPIVLYDLLADRWLLSQFALPNDPAPPFYECIAISQTADPTGAYYLYQFKTNLTDKPSAEEMPDYPKLAVWPDAYYMATNEKGVSVYAFDRAKMLNGQPATFQKFQVKRNFMLPGDLDGSMPPPASSPGHFYTMLDDTYWPAHGIPGVDRLELWDFHVDFVVPANSTFSQTANLPTAHFNYTVCGYFNSRCIPQKNSLEKLDALSEWPMWRLQYRNFGSHETLAGNFTVDVSGNHHAGLRWFELRKTGSSAWSIHQQGTHAPDAHHRWVGSIAMDKDGNIALGYSVSSSSLYPSIRYATRLASDAPGTLQAEVTLMAGSGSQFGGGSRWGDYSSMNVDPADDCTFWYTNEYYSVTSGIDWRTRIGAFRIPSCMAGRAYLPMISRD